ncbi:rhomboid family intramembrane serine protease [Nocardioides lianchengensis]|uniref:Rhomboid family protein n=1 Tax=Nocardioides lianchengensis TaxID=1045774 RepID=A0A1G7AUJ3_9ACTN|nr:rhomboid family intramembrane serine protease [Nocardioides lianchengensis]NYG13307.1 membrane associated rhomboid family serine protease [Nocardioides lianchengensis]SDE18544.1 Rhomboid family protein [Nocardioides lianchengensis]
METRRPVWQQAIGLVGGFVVVLWVLEIVDSVADHRLDQYGVRPRDAEGLLGIAFAPLLHGGWGHLEANTVPVVVLGFLVLATGIARGLAATGVIWVVGGLGTWLVAPSYTVHIGASVLIFGWMTYLLVRGVLNRSLAEVLIGLGVLVIWGGLLWGVLPGDPGVSWQGHLFGAVGGVVAAWVLRPDRSVASRHD